MPRFKQTTDILRLMSHKQNIRNIGIIAHIDHGKTTMTDSLLAEAGLLSPKIAGTARALDYLEEEQKRGITIKTANISLLHEEPGTAYVINLIDTPGHVDFTGKVTRALRATDGAIIVVDAVEEIMVQTETVTRQALNERVRPVLYINKIDRLIKELRLTTTDIQKKLTHIINDFNNLITLYAEPEHQEKWKVDPAKDTVAFGSALHKWGFTLGIAQQKNIKFNDIINAYQKNTVEQLAETIPLHNAILNMVVNHLPNPITAQQYRLPKIWTGNLDTEIGQAMLNCTDTGPTVMCVTMTQTDPHAGLIATGRLFSGKVTAGNEIYLVEAKKNHRVQQVSMYMGAIREIVDQINAGNIAALLGIEQARTGETLVDNSHKDTMIPFEHIRYISEPVITIALEPTHPKDLPRLTEAMQRLTIEDPNLTATISKETGEYLLSGIGELHLEIATKFLRDYAGGDLEIITGKPIVVYRESVTAKGIAAQAKSPNKLNKLIIQVQPLEDNVIELIEKSELTEDTNPRQISTTLQKKANWTTAEAENVWAIEQHKNILVNEAKSIQFTHETRDTIISGFKWACQNGPLCEEPIRGIKAKLIDAQLHEDPAHHGPAQLVPATRRAILGSFLTAKASLVEPIFKINITAPTQWVGQVSSIITRQKGRITASEQKGPINNIVGYIPVRQTFGLAAEMRSATSGHAFWQSTLDHWEKIPASTAHVIIREIRKRRGLPPEIPVASKFIDEP
ncbi:MAG TPA: elongation factor EF-2 [Candidatus Bathyarchaeia archaeon]|nr:elongation factor EF-2 [Candidatus Bathyarchaeia archaeon]